MKKRQRKKLELQERVCKTSVELSNVKNGINGQDDKINALESKIMANTSSIKNLVDMQTHMQLENWGNFSEMKSHVKKHINGIYVMILVIILLEVVQWLVLR